MSALQILCAAAAECTWATVAAKEWARRDFPIPESPRNRITVVTWPRGWLPPPPSRRVRRRCCCGPSTPLRSKCQRTLPPSTTSPWNCCAIRLVPSSATPESLGTNDAQTEASITTSRMPCEPKPNLGSLATQLEPCSSFPAWATTRRSDAPASSSPSRGGTANFFAALFRTVSFRRSPWPALQLSSPSSSQRRWMLCRSTGARSLNVSCSPNCASHASSSSFFSILAGTTGRGVRATTCAPQTPSSSKGGLKGVQPVLASTRILERAAGVPATVERVICSLAESSNHSWSTASTSTNKA
mmetsp:Transcript_30513/g.64915  ORF Transcript_30513/g.64915 Transcript_30513/m.64915 type:complete len:300 (-) Transcript_30513:1316-2215(-)